jgi:hypothetical protein
MFPSALYLVVALVALQNLDVVLHPVLFLAAMSKKISILLKFYGVVMKDCLVISELSYFHEVTGIDIVGGKDVAATTGTIATARPGYASSGAFASAEGEYIGIQTQTNAVNGSNFSSADATAKAYGRTGKNTAQSLSASNASSVTNGHSITGRASSVSFDSTT